ncbi:MAG: peptide ABC transporter substrate-binding protein [Anaerolineae bacterium]|nr:peptide ABC transporter substrate-binding protein [Anaerolineae bacterium]
MSKYVRWQVLLTLLGIILIASLLFYVSVEEKTVEPTPTLTLSSATTVVKTRGGTYIEGVAGYPQLINPLFSLLNDIDRDLCALIFEGLTAVNERNEIVPLLAERWQVSDNGLEYVFHLRDDVRWQDGEPFTADDVVFTIGLMQSPDLAAIHPHAALWRSVVVEKLDPMTIKFVLGEPYAAFLDYTTLGIVPKHILDGVSTSELVLHPFNYAPVGTGLFKVSELDPASYIVLETNPYHYLWGETMLDRVEFRFYDSYHHAFAAYEAGKVMGMGRILTEDLDRARANPNLQILSARLSGYGLIFLNLANDDKPFFQDRRVRQALLYALDRQLLIDQVLAGQGIVIHSPIMPQSWAYNPDVEQYAQDLGMAVTLLEQAGFKLPDPQKRVLDESVPGDEKIRVKEGQKLEFVLLTDTEPDHVALAHAVAEQWEAVGVRVLVQSLSISDLALNYLQPRRFDAALLEWPSQLDPDPYPMWHETQTEGTGQNYGSFLNRDASEAIEVARQLTDRGERTGLYYQFQDIFAQEVPAILLYQPIYTFGVDKRVRNVQISPMFDPSGRFRNIWQWAPLEKEVLLRDLNDQEGDKLDRQGNPWYDSVH